MDTQIEYHGPTDTHGRCHFSLRWIDDYFPGHPEGEHVRRERGQHFHADPRKYGHLRPEEKEICRCSINAPENLETICHPCHMKLHWQLNPSFGGTVAKQTQVTA